MTEKSLPPAICLMGPTASGKTDLAIEIAERLPCDIISVDSALIYRGMDIGSAKPDAETLVRAPHRLIDIRDPAQTYSGQNFALTLSNRCSRLLPLGASRCWWAAP